VVYRQFKEAGLNLVPIDHVLPDANVGSAGDMLAEPAFLLAIRISSLRGDRR
jgi:hypothetical protein